MQTPIYLNTLETHGVQLGSLIAELEENFPQFLPQPGDSINAIMYKSGQRSVVEWIQQRLADDNG
jgi:hypothetical protein